MQENWNLYTDLTLEATPWIWPDTTWEDLTAANLEGLPTGTDDFTRYSPTDGPVDAVHVPTALPREQPVCQTALTVLHEKDCLYLFIVAKTPDHPIARLKDDPREDFSLVIPLGGRARGLYFGMNETGEAIGCVQIWDADVQPTDACDQWPFSLLKGDPRKSNERRAVLPGECYAAKVIPIASGRVGCFRIHRKLLHAAVESGAVKLSAGRMCMATGEWVSWGSPIIWSPRDDRHGTVQLVDAASPPPALPRLHRLDLRYDPGPESGALLATWRGTEPETIGRLRVGSYADYAHKVTVALNGIERVTELAPLTEAAFSIPNGWNRLEVLTAAAAPFEISFQKVSGNEVAGNSAADPDAGMPGLEELQKAFASWHDAHEARYLGNGIWGDSAAPVHCLCHAGIFNIEPYLLAKPHVRWEPVYEARIRETCARMLAQQHPEGWFPCFCSAVRATEPELGDGGAFTNGSVGEGLALAGHLLGEDAWVEASRRAADYSWYRTENNQNYCAFVLWHMAALHACCPTAEWLETGAYYARHFAGRDIGIGGAQDGHNYFTGYGNITLKGMARFLAMLPEGHELRPWLRDKVIRFTNQIILRQQPSGLFAGRNRKYLGYHHPVPGLFFVAEALPETAAALRPVLAAQTRAVLRGADEDPARQVSADDGLVLAHAMRHSQLATATARQSAF